MVTNEHPTPERDTAVPQTPRIIFLNRSYWPDAEATGQLLTDLCEQLACSGFDVHVVCGQPNTTVDAGSFQRSGVQERKQVTIHRLRHSTFRKRIPAGRMLNLLSFYRSANSYLRRTRLAADIIVPETDPFLIPVAGAAHARRVGAKLVCYVQDVYPDIAEALGKVRPGMVTRAIRGRLRGVYEAADRVVVLSDCMKQRLVRRPWSLDPERLLVIPNWADCSSIFPLDPEKNPFRRQYALDDQFIVMHSGNMGLSQNLDVLIDAARRSDWPSDAILVLVGDGASRAKLEQQAGELLGSRIFLLPYQPRSMLASSLSAADLHVVSMADNVTGCLSPSKLYGILAAGRPTLAIASPSSHLYQIVSHEGLGWSCRPGDSAAIVRAVAEAASEPAHCRGAGKRARALAEQHYDRAVVVGKLTNMFREVADESSKTQFDIEKGQPECRLELAQE